MGLELSDFVNKKLILGGGFFGMANMLCGDYMKNLFFCFMMLKGGFRK